ncbi:hypothetical protein [Flavobacterium sp.]|uniref:hypothetical protein n=1 Tax=Flavobacterium sp. TaxID=239 RepID=UPI0038FCD1A9
MKLTKLNTTILVNYNLKSYLIDWNRKVSGPQKKVKDFLHKYWENDIICEELLIKGSLLRLDLINFTKKIIIEVSPRALHVNYNKFMHGGRSGYLKKLQSDAKKMEWSESNGFIFIELYDENINNLSVKMFKDEFSIDL